MTTITRECVDRFLLWGYIGVNEVNQGFEMQITVWFSAQCMSVNSVHRYAEQAASATDFNDEIEYNGTVIQTGHVFPVTLPCASVAVEDDYSIVIYRDGTGHESVLSVDADLRQHLKNHKHLLGNAAVSAA